MSKNKSGQTAFGAHNQNFFGYRHLTNFFQKIYCNIWETKIF